MPITKSNLSQKDREALQSHAAKHKVYPYRYPFRKTINATNFATADGSIGSYFTLSFTSSEILPVISIAAAYIITPNTTVDIFAAVVSYSPTMSLADGNANTPADEGGMIYKLLSNGGAINDFQVFYPTVWYLERNTKLYMHVYAGATTVTAATSTITGHFILGTLPTGM